MDINKLAFRVWCEFRNKMFYFTFKNFISYNKNSIVGINVNGLDIAIYANQNGWVPFLNFMQKSIFKDCSEWKDLTDEEKEKYEVDGEYVGPNFCGKNIFEGDIVTIDIGEQDEELLKYYGLVTFGYDTFSILLFNSIKNEINLSDMDGMKKFIWTTQYNCVKVYYEAKNIKVIGNKYEHPHKIEMAKNGNFPDKDGNSRY